MHQKRIRNEAIVSRPQARLFAFGPKVATALGCDDWSELQNLQTQIDVPEEGRFIPSGKNAPIVRALRVLAREHGLGTVYMPFAGPASGIIAEGSDWSDIRLNDNFTLRVNYHRPADGVFLERGEAFAMIGAGCPVIFARAGDIVIVAHAGRDSLIDRGAVMGNASRKHLSVVHAMLEAFGNKGIPSEEIEMYMHFAIPNHAFSHPYDHPKHGERNYRLRSYLKESGWQECFEERDGALFLSLEQLFTLQAMHARIKMVSAGNSLAFHPELAHTRDGHPEAARRRNLIVVAYDP